MLLVLQRNKVIEFLTELNPFAHGKHAILVARENFNMLIFHRETNDDMQHIKRNLKLQYGKRQQQ